MSDPIFLVKPEECTEHSFMDLARFFNGCSAWGTKMCQKCGTEYNWQFDLGGTPGYQETKPY